MLHKHKHNECEHTDVLYCKHCRVVYCKQCNLEWVERYSFSWNSTNVWTSPGTTKGWYLNGSTEDSLNNTTPVKVTHTHNED